MAIIPITRRHGRAIAIAMRPEDRFDHPAIAPERSSVTAWLIGTAVVAGSVAGLLLYEGGRPIASGAIPPPLPLMITVEPMTAGDAQPR